MVSGAPDYTKLVKVTHIFDHSEKVPIYDVAPVQGRYRATPPTLTDGDFGESLMDENGRLIVNAILDDYTTWPTNFPDSAVLALLAARLPAALDSLSLKVKEQSPISGFATSSNQSTIIGHVDGIEGLLGGGLPAALDSLSLKVKEQSPISALNVTEQSWPSLIEEATTPTIYNETMTLADTEYDQALSSNTRKFMVMTRDRSAFRLAFETDKVATPTAPYITIAANEVYYDEFVNSSSLTLYYASDNAGKIIEIVEWV